MFRLSFILLLVALLPPAVAQESGWQQGQANATMCYWQSPRAAVIRDTLYIDGGYLWWEPGMSDGTYGGVTYDGMLTSFNIYIQDLHLPGNPLGLVYQLNFNTSFASSDNFSTIFTTISRGANNIGPQYYDGGMFANDYEWITYGGLLAYSLAASPQLATAFSEYFVYPTIQTSFTPGFQIGTLPDGVTRYVTDGAAVSVPSENLGFYFSGLRANSSGPIYFPSDNETVNADQLSDTLIKVDMGVEYQEKWSNITLPPTVPGRANAEVVWVPVSEQGILVAIGGVVKPAYDNANQTDNVADTLESTTISPTFMSTVSVYDINQGTWYEQTTSGGPGALAQGCAVVASAEDGSSHNIYWYGGFDGLHLENPYSDDVWVLSLPSFIWVQVYTGDNTHGRAGHKCVKPYPDQMFVIAGSNAFTSETALCLEGGMVQVFNLSSTTWIDSYDPKIWSNYTVPELILSKIGGTPTGGATESSPTASGFANPNLASIFGSPYNSSKITTYYPYNPSPTTTHNSTTLLPTPVSKSSLPSYLGPVLGVVLGLFVITLVVLAFMLYRHRRSMRLNGTNSRSELGTMDNSRGAVWNWLRGMAALPAGSSAKPPTVTTDDTPASPEPEAEYKVREAQEMPGDQVHEMGDTSRAVELSSDQQQPLGFVAIGGSNPKNTNRTPLNSSPSITSRTSRTSSVSRSSGPGARPPVSPRADSPPLGSEDHGHLRGISETSVSTDGGGHYSPIPLGELEGDVVSSERPGVVSPLSPPVAAGSERRGPGHIADYFDKEQSDGESGGEKKSNFIEGVDEKL
ncbi:hypothetical protein B7494_g5867 [Chlorociboria aeruginascens]|nr:hypothetical protein B7494_g5867 [Chlorociboria aeruginascens]